MWEGNINPNPWAWTDKHIQFANARQYSDDSPDGVPQPGYPLPSFSQVKSQAYDGPYNWPDDKVPEPWLGNLHHNPGAWTADHMRDSNESEYENDTPRGVPASRASLNSLAQQRVKRKHHKRHHSK